MKQINKMMAAMMIMSIAAVMPATACNKRGHKHCGKPATVVVVKDHHRPDYCDRGYREAPRQRPHHAHYRPDVRTCTFRVPHHRNRASLDLALRIGGVMDAHWNPLTHEITVRYDACRTTSHHIIHIAG